MNAQNYTQKSLEAIQAAQKLTIENQNQQIEQIHLLAALLRQENGYGAEQRGRHRKADEGRICLRRASVFVPD